jgi:spermidine synthase
MAKKPARRSPPAPRREPPLLLLLLPPFFLSGACGLVYEVIWSRLLVLVFGSTTHAVATVLGVFMFGLAAGSAVCGRVIHRLGSPLRAYALAELLIGLYLLAFFPLLAGAQLLHSVAFGALFETPPALTAARFGICFALLFVPTFLMGATVPLFAQLAVRSATAAGRRVGIVYAVNTLGAALGCFAGAFLLIPALGLHVSLVLAATVNTAIGGYCWGVRRWVTPPRVDGARTQPPAALPGRPGARIPPRARLALGFFLLTGMVSLVLEVAWTRALILVFGSSVYAFAAMLTAFLVGIGLGSALFAGPSDRVENQGQVFAVLVGIMGVSVLASTPLIGKLPAFFLDRFGTDIPWGHLVALEFGVCLALMLFPTLSSGAMFPLVTKLVMQETDRQPGDAVGTVYFWNTVGGIVGSLAAGFALIPLLGIERTLIVGGCSALAISLGVWIALAGRPVRQLPWAVAALGSAAAGFFLLTPRWDTLVMNSGVYVHGKAIASANSPLAEYMSRFRLLYYREDHTATVAVLEGVHRFLRVNGKTDGGTGDNYTQTLLGVLPNLYAPRAQRGLVIGLGTGITAGSVLDLDSYGAVDVIELSPAVVEASRFFDRESGRPLDDPRVALHLLDGRTWVMAGPHRYDVVTSEPSHPWQTGNANLFTVDFFRLLRERMHPGGVVCQWLPYYHMSKEHFLLILNSFREVFPYIHVWVAATDAILIASERELQIDETVLERYLSEERLKGRLASANIRTRSDLLGFFWIDAAGVDRLTREVSGVNSDRHPVVEFAAPKYLLRPFDQDSFLALFEQSHAARLPLAASASDDRDRLLSRAKYFKEWGIPEYYSDEMLRRAGAVVH